MLKLNAGMRTTQKATSLGPQHKANVPVLNPRVRRMYSSCGRFCPGPRENALLTFTAMAAALLSRTAAPVSYTHLTLPTKA